MNRILFWLLIFLSLSTIAEDKIGDQVQFVSEQDRAMNEAIVAARNKLKDFFETANNPPEGADGFKLKVMV